MSVGDSTPNRGLEKREKIHIEAGQRTGAVP